MELAKFCKDYRMNPSVFEGLDAGGDIKDILKTIGQAMVDVVKLYPEDDSSSHFYLVADSLAVAFRTLYFYNQHKVGHLEVIEKSVW